MTTAHAAEEVAASLPFRVAARTGYAVNGLLHVLVGLIAIRIVRGTAANGDADQSGALAQIARARFGDALLWILVAGLLALAVWNIVQVAQTRGSRSRSQQTRGIRSKHPWTRRVNDASRGIGYLAIAGVTFTFARGGKVDSVHTETSLSALALQLPGGRYVLAALGMTIVGVGVYFMLRGITRLFRNELRPLRGPAGVVVVVLGVVGFIAEGIALIGVGALFVFAALEFDPHVARGLDGSLLALAALPFGAVVLVVVGGGLMFYGCYLGVRAVWGKL